MAPPPSSTGAVKDSSMSANMGADDRSGEDDAMQSERLQELFVSNQERSAFNPWGVPTVGTARVQGVLDRVDELMAGPPSGSSPSSGSSGGEDAGLAAGDGSDKKNGADA